MTDQDLTRKERKEKKKQDRIDAARDALPDDPEFADYLAPYGEYDQPIYTGLIGADDDDDIVVRIISRRASWIAAEYDIDKKLSKAIAYSECGYSSVGIADKLDVTSGTVDKYMERIEREFGHDVLAQNPPHDFERELPIGGADRRECPECGERRMVSLAAVNRVFTTKTDGFARAFDGARKTGATHICSACNTPQRLGGADVSEGEETVVTGFYDNVPDELREIDRWLVWEERTVGEKTAKMPIAPWATEGMKRVNAHNPFAWTSFDEAVDWAMKVPGYGLEFIIRPDDDYVLIDLDDCVDSDGNLSADARRVIETFDTYAEFSPSGNGAHVICKGDVPDGYRNVEGFEVYDGARACTFTGNTIRDTGVRECQGEIEAFCEEFLDDAPTTGLAVDDIDTDRSASNVLASLTIPDIYPEIAPGERGEHPVHGSKQTGANFMPHSDDEGATAMCWRCDVGLNAGHLLAMEALGVEDCAEIRHRWADDDEVVLEAWVHAVEQYGIDADPPPSRAIMALARLGGADPDEDYGNAWTVGTLIARKRHGFDVEE